MDSMRLKLPSGDTSATCPRARRTSCHTCGTLRLSAVIWPDSRAFLTASSSTASSGVPPVTSVKRHIIRQFARRVDAAALRHDLPIGGERRDGPADEAWRLGTAPAIATA